MVVYLNQFLDHVFLLSEIFQNRILGIHVVGPNAGEMIQGFSIALKCGATKEHLDNLIGIHPTNAEVSKRNMLKSIRKTKTIRPVD